MELLLHSKFLALERQQNVEIGMQNKNNVKQNIHKLHTERSQTETKLSELA